jgi:hypothetical protein
MNMMLTLYRSFVIVGVLLSMMACHAHSRTDLLRVIDETPAKNLRSYQFDASSSLLARVKPPPDFVVSFWGRTDKAFDYASYMPTVPELGMIDEYLSKLPRHLKDVLQDRLVAIYFINNLRGSGVTDYVLNDHYDVYLIMLFNPAALKTDISTWMTFRENSCFTGKAPDEVSLKINCGKQYSGFLYALVHESAHAVDYVESYTPYTEKQIKIIRQVKTTQTLFTKDVWTDRRTPLAPYDFPSRRNLTFYGTDGGPKISISDTPRIYKQFAATPFVSLYGSMNWADDFADTVMFYHLTQVLGQPYEIHLTSKSGSSLVLRPMDSSLVKARFSVIQSLY